MAQNSDCRFFSSFSMVVLRVSNTSAATRRSGGNGTSHAEIGRLVILCGVLKNDLFRPFSATIVVLSAFVVIDIVIVQMN